MFATRFAALILVIPTCASALDLELVRDVRPGTAGSSPDLRRGTTRAGAPVLYFSAVVDGNGTKYLWRSDGSEAGTFVLADVPVTAIQPMPEGGAYFIAATPATGRALFRTDGDSGYELAWDPVADAPDGLERNELVLLGDEVGVDPMWLAGAWTTNWTTPPHQFSRFDDGLPFGFAAGEREIILPNSSRTAPALVAGGVTGLGRAMLPAPEDDPPISNGAHLVWASGAVLCGKAFATLQGAVLHCVDPTRTWLRRIFPPALRGNPIALSDLQAFGPLRDKLAFIASSRLWVTDGSSAGTTLVAEAPGFFSQCIQTDRAERMFYANGNGDELWTATAAPGSNRRVATGPFSSFGFGVGPQCQDRRSVARWNGIHAIAAAGLVLSDGTPEGSTLHPNPIDGVAIMPPIATMAGSLYAAGCRADVGCELFRVRWPDLLQSSFEND
jgi:ELWxxDGT repeat protein